MDLDDDQSEQDEGKDRPVPLAPRLRPYSAGVASGRRVAEAGAGPDEVDRAAALAFERELIALDDSDPRTSEFPEVLPISHRCICTVTHLVALRQAHGLLSEPTVIEPWPHPQGDGGKVPVHGEGVVRTDPAEPGLGRERLALGGLAVGALA